MPFFSKITSFSKDFILFSRIGLIFLPFSNLLKFLSNLSLLTRWLNKNHKNAKFTDFYRPIRKYAHRENLHQFIVDTYSLAEKEIHYFEFGVSTGVSFKWWLGHNSNPNSEFHGFDTFEGLPEDWNFYKKGAMSSETPHIEDKRGVFHRGLFQDTLYDFLEDYRLRFGVKNKIQRVIHMDADLYSSTLFGLTLLAPYLQKGDIIMFDEFNVANHEFAAWNDFVRSFYPKYELIGGANNYYQAAFVLL